MGFNAREFYCEGGVSYLREDLQMLLKKRITYSTRGLLGLKIDKNHAPRVATEILKLLNG
jgi:hypothetical protein